MAGIFGFYAFSEGKENSAKKLDAIHFSAKVKSRLKGMSPIIISRLIRSK